jgi:hypothetical protein
VPDRSIVPSEALKRFCLSFESPPDSSKVTLAERADMGFDYLIPFIPTPDQAEAFGRGLHMTGRLLIYIGGILMLLF